MCAAARAAQPRVLSFFASDVFVEGFDGLGGEGGYAACQALAAALQAWVALVASHEEVRVRGERWG